MPEEHYGCIPHKNKPHMCEKAAEVLCIEKVVPWFRQRGPRKMGVLFAHA